MSSNFVKFFCLSLVALYGMIGLSEQAIYPYAKAVSKTLTELDLKKVFVLSFLLRLWLIIIMGWPQLEGHWYGVYHRKPKDKETDTCPQLDVKAGNGYVNLTERFVIYLIVWSILFLAFNYLFLNFFDWKLNSFIGKFVIIFEKPRKRQNWIEENGTKPLLERQNQPGY